MFAAIKILCVNFYIKEKYPRIFTGFSIGVRTIITTSVYFKSSKNTFDLHLLSLFRMFERLLNILLPITECLKER